MSMQINGHGFVSKAEKTEMVAYSRNTNANQQMRATFFFQAEDGIRDHCETGVQTCALPIFGHWNEIAQQVSAERGLDLVADARLFALLNLATGDAIISAWDAKYEYNFWRPVTAIQFSGEIGRASCRERVERWEVAGS